jgi:hypothetical protein
MRYRKGAGEQRAERRVDPTARPRPGTRLAGRLRRCSQTGAEGAGRMSLGRDGRRSRALRPWVQAWPGGAVIGVLKGSFARRPTDGAGALTVYFAAL